MSTPSSLHSGRFVARFAHQLSVHAGVPVAARRLPGSDRSTPIWQLTWRDGPSVALMRYRVAGLRSSVAGVVVEDLHWQRTVSSTAFAMELLRNLRSGTAAPGEHLTTETVMRSLDRVDHPERGPLAEVALAQQLAAVCEHRQDAMVRYLELYGTPGLASAGVRGALAIDASAVVVDPGAGPETTVTVATG
ncbi:hypothetical protein FB561_5698 [Kribbella amoyensis]|uniref:Uncharacterized protein n=2 Tax=Kribbella amoyensis TaxID=996641 RepID=A0A561BZZ5_9ACTN|nr:hypothetical protein FB561_5698 [Kribbella amoyensis]